MPEPVLAQTRGLGGRRGLFLLLGLGLLLRLPTFCRPLLSDDEAIYATTADAMRRGAVLYRDAVDHKPPAIYYIYEAGLAFFEPWLGPFAMVGPHLLVVLAVLATAVVIAELGRGAGGPREALVAAGAFLIFSTTWHDYDALAANCELFLLLPQALAAWLLLRGAPDEPWARWSARQLGVGVLVGLSALCKYQGIAFLGAVWVWLVATAVTAPVRAGRWARLLVAMGLGGVGALLPALAFLLRAAATGGLDASVAWFRFNFSYIGAGLTGAEAAVRGLRRLALVGGMALPVYLGGIAGAAGIMTAILRGARTRGRGPVTWPAPRAWFLLGWLGTATVGLVAGGRFFGHYFHLVLPPLALLAAPILSRFWDMGRGRRVLLVAGTGVPALLFFALATFARPLAERLDHTEPAYEPVAARIAALTSPGERIFVWGNSPQLYVLSGRAMGTRFSFCNYMTGESPGTGTETGALNADENSLPAAWSMLFEDLERRRPALFVDAAAAGWDGYEKFPLRRYPRLQAYLHGHYRPAEVVDGVAIYRRSP